MASVEEDFPRGGTAKKPTESKIVAQRTEVDNLFQVEFIPFFLSLCPHIYEGMLMLGCVKEVADFEVTVSLPCGLRGFLSIKNISDSYTKLLNEQLESEICSLPHLFYPGMVLRCVVAKLDVARGGSLSIQLSINPKLVNKGLTSSSLKAGMVLSGCVESVEDHGCIVDIGLSGSKAFLPMKTVKDKHNNPEELKVGQYVTSHVDGVKNEGRVVQLSVNPLTISQACAESTQGWNLTNLLPGLLLKSTIKKVTKHGLILDFLSSFSGQVDFLHMEPEQASDYTEGTEVQARVLYVEPTTRLVGLSLRSFLVQPGKTIDPTPAGGDRIGEVVKCCKITTIHHMSGAMLELPGETLAFVHVMSVLLNHGMVVHLSDHIKGLVPRTHLSDIILKNPEKKYIEGMKVKCRVLSVDAENKKLYLTRKKALVESSLPLFLSFTDARPGSLSHGYIVCIKNFGCIVRFYNSVKGLVPLSELSSEPIINPEEVFYVGQVLKTKVLQCDPDKAKMVLSFKAAAKGETEEPAKPQLEAKVLKKLLFGLEVAILPDEIKAILPTMHLSDHMSNCPLLWESLQEGDNISNLISFSHFLNMKSRSVEGVVAKDFSEITVGMQLIGWVKNIMSYGVFVEFPYGLVGLAPKSAMSDKFISDATAVFQLGQTVIAKVTNLDEEKRRFLITLKMSEVTASESDAQTRLINGLQERRVVNEMLAMKGMHVLSLNEDIPAFSLCRLLHVASLPFNTLHFLFYIKYMMCFSGVNLTSGQKATAVILHVDILSTCVHVSILSKLVGNKKSLNEGSKYTAMVQYTDKDFAVISLGDTAQLTVIQTTSHLNEILLFESEKLKAGRSLAVEVTERNCQELQGLPLVSWQRTASKRQRTTSENQSGSKGHRFGEILQGKVRTVKPTCIQVALDDGSTGSVHVSEVVENTKVCLGSFPTSSVKVGSVVNVRVIGGREASSHRFLPFSHPRFTYTTPDTVHCLHKLEKGSVTLGIVTNILPQVGLMVKLPFGGMGTVAVTDLADAYRPKPLDGYSKDQLIRCFLLGCENGKWQLSLRPSRLNPEQAKPMKDPEVLSVDKLKAGQVIRGYVKAVREQALASQHSAHHQDPQVQKKKKKKHLSSGFLFSILVLSIDEEEELVDLSLLPVDTGKPDVLPESLGLPLRLIGEEKKKHDSMKKKKRTLSESEQKQAESQVPKKKKKTKKAKTEDNDSGVEVYFREDDDKEDEEEPKPDPAKVTGPARLQVAAGFSWDVGLNSLKPASAAQGGDSSDGEDQDRSSKKKSRHEVEQEKKAAEKALVQRETELMDPNLRPEDAAAFERLLLASPNSSLLWLQYMAHHLQATQIEQARAVAERALKTISFREEQEKLNVWVALLNLENMYGTEETLKKVFERALQFCEPMPVYQQLADIYAKSNKTKEAESLYKTMTKRFRQNKAVWLSYGTFLLQQGQSDSASALLQRALKSLPSKESVDVIAKFAQLEFRYGDVEKGRTMFDKVLTSYPKRTDLWSVFIDLMVKHGSQKEVRALFDRVIHLSVSVKKIKFFFKRYLEYEKKHGTPQSIQAVKEKAMEFVEAKDSLEDFL
uniref:Protein RRP5 homolog n=1 Tax=Seriola dumerili TaxID=41447 RepID=A0A3B4VFG8_SERDU